MKLEAHPLTKDRWKDLVELFSRPGGSIVRGCWCMYYRRSGGPSGVGRGETNKQALRSLVGGGVMKPVDDKPVWSIVCFYVDRQARGQGVSEALLRAAMDYARSRGVRLLEAYPVDKPERSHPDFMFFGAKRMYDRAGFKEVARRKAARPVVRKALRPGPGKAAN